MKKDLFIDTNIASRFANPADPAYKKLIRWLFNNPEAHLAVSNKLLQEYIASSRNAASDSSIPVLISALTREGRLVKINNDQIKRFKQQYFTKAQCRKLRSNSEDRNHIPVVLLSDRKYALSIDELLIQDLLSFPGFTVRAERRPDRLLYE
ncbi:MAG: hypothetical protein NW241_01500 [Bacteroidia bacterium]|nr:hypothetical protein [Bacteroidia bacterium]